MNLAVVYSLIGYLSGSILYADVFAKLFKKDIYKDSRDKNPGTANAFQFGGFRCGLCTLICELLKGFLPVYCYVNYVHRTGQLQESAIWLATVCAAPVLGHIFPVFYGFNGGKGIAATFGSLLGLFPEYKPLAAFIIFFIGFSLVLRITPHFYRTIATYLCTALYLLVLGIRDGNTIGFGFCIITVFVCFKMHFSKEEKEKMQIHLLWK